MSSFMQKQASSKTPSLSARRDRLKREELSQFRARTRKVLPGEIRDLRELIRYRYTLDHEIWNLRAVRFPDRFVVEEKMRKSTAVLRKIKDTLLKWDRREYFESEQQFYMFQQVRDRIFADGKRDWPRDPPWVEMDHFSVPHANQYTSVSSQSVPSYDDRLSMYTLPTTIYESEPGRHPIISVQDNTDMSGPSAKIEESTQFSSTRLSQIRFTSESTDTHYGAEPTSFDHPHKKVEPLGPTTLLSSSHFAEELNRSKDNSQSDGAPEEEDMGYLLDPATYYTSLDDLELRVADTIGITSHYKVEEQSISLRENNETLQRFSVVNDALRLLRREGFCSDEFSIFAQDADRFDSEGILAARTISIHFYSLTDLSLMEDRNENWTGSATRSFSDEAFLISYLERLGIRRTDTSAADMTRSSPFNMRLDIFLQNLRVLILILKIGILSYSGSHACPFDESVFGMKCDNFDLGCGYTFRRRKLRCLHQFVGGPVWVLEKTDTPPGDYMLSITPKQFTDLWGPLRTESLTADLSHFVKFYPERGVIVSTAHSLSSKGEIMCHYSMKSDKTTNVGSPVQPITMESKLLIGMAPTETETVVNSSFKPNNSCTTRSDEVQRAKSHLFQFPGTHDDYYAHEQSQINASAGMYVTAGVAKVNKRYPGTTWKKAIMSRCKKPGFDILPILKLKVGLEISSCTFNAQRITLWNALTLTNNKGRVKDSGPLFLRPKARSCPHAVGDMDCIATCWKAQVDAKYQSHKGKSRHASDNHGKEELRRIVVRSMEELEDTGIDPAGDLQAWWPFSEEPQTLRIQREGKEASNWIQMLKDSKFSATFAVISDKCLEYEYMKGEKEKEYHVWRKCLKSRRNRRKLEKLHRRETRVYCNQTILATALKLHPEYRSNIIPSNRLCPLGTRLGLANIGYLKITNEDNKQPQLAKLETGWAARLGGNVTDFISTERYNKHTEFLNGDESVAHTLRLFVV